MEEQFVKYLYLSNTDGEETVGPPLPLSEVGCL